MRDRFAEVAGRLLDEDTRLTLVLADIGVSKFDDLGVTARHPDRVVNVGIREQLMIGDAAGMALEGLRPIVHSYTPFLVERPFEQIKLDLGHQDVGAVLVSIGASYDAADSGRTHQAPEDVALLASLPGWHIDVPGHYAATVRPFDGETLRAELGDATDVVLVEPYLTGTSSGVTAKAPEETPHRLLALGVDEPELRKYGTPRQHRAAHGLDAPGLATSIKRFIRVG